MRSETGDQQAGICKGRFALAAATDEGDSNADATVICTISLVDGFSDKKRGLLLIESTDRDPR